MFSWVHRDRWIVVLLAALFIAGIWAFPLLEPDEGRYAEIAAQMVRSGDWLTPRLTGLPYFEKPVLFFWMAAASMSVFGENEFAARLPSALSALLTVLLVMGWAMRIGGRRSGLLAGALLASLAMFVGLSRVVLVDVTLTLFTTATLYSAYRGVVEGPPIRKWILAFWVCLALGALTKGPIGIGIPAASVALFLGLMREWRKLWALLRPDGWLVFFAVAAPWTVAVSLKNPGYPKEFLWRQNFERFISGGQFGRDQPLWFYAAVLAGAFLPCSLFLPEMIRRVVRDWRCREEPRPAARLYLATTLVVPFVVLTIAQSKLMYYLLPLCPPFALLLGETWAQDDGRGWRRLASVGGLMLLAAAIVLVWQQLNGEWFLDVFHGREPSRPGSMAVVERFRQLQAFMPTLALFALWIGSAFVAGAVLLRRQKTLWAAAILAAGVGGASALWPFLAGNVFIGYSSKGIARILQERGEPDEPVVCFRYHLRGLRFYYPRATPILWKADFNEFGHEPSPEELKGRSLQANPELLRALGEQRRSLLIVADGRDRVGQLQEIFGAPVEELGRSGDFLVLRYRSRRTQ